MEISLLLGRACTISNILLTGGEVVRIVELVDSMGQDFSPLRIQMVVRIQTQVTPQQPFTGVSRKPKFGQTVELPVIDIVKPLLDI